LPKSALTVLLLASPLLANKTDDAMAGSGFRQSSRRGNGCNAGYMTVTRITKAINEGFPK
jgi:hypothetical protein